MYAEIKQEGSRWLVYELEGGLIVATATCATRQEAKDRAATITARKKAENKRLHKIIFGNMHK